MGHRLSRIVTRTGDSGSSGLATGERLPKTHPRFAAMGDVDELNAQIGLLLTQTLPPAIHASLLQTQHELFDLGGELSMPGQALLKEAAVLRLDQQLAELNEALPPLKEFVLPGGSPAAAQAHVARTVARRAERALWGLHEQDAMNAAPLQYLNRLSDYLFVVARTLARAQGSTEPSWQKA